MRPQLPLTTIQRALLTWVFLWFFRNPDLNGVRFTSLALIVDLLTNHRGIPSESASSLPIFRPPNFQRPTPSYSLPTYTRWRVLPQQSSNDIQSVKVKTLTFRTFDISEVGLLRKPVSHLRQTIASRGGISPPLSDIRLIYKRRSLDDNSRTLADYDIASGDTIHLVLKLRGGKPVIYLFPPSSLPNVTIELLLTSSWHFSAVYPSPQTTIPFGENQPPQYLTWAVAAEPDGTLVNKSTGTEVTYLYWEAM